MYRTTLHNINKNVPRPIQPTATKIASLAFKWPHILNDKLHSKCQNSWCQEKYCQNPLDPEAYVKLKKNGVECPLPITLHSNGQLTVPRCLFTPHSTYQQLKPWYGDLYVPYSQHADHIRQQLRQNLSESKFIWKKKKSKDLGENRELPEKVIDVDIDPSENSAAKTTKDYFANKKRSTTYQQQVQSFAENFYDAWKKR